MTKLSRNFGIFYQLFTCLKLRYRVFPQENSDLFLQVIRSYDISTSKRCQSEKFVEIWSNFLEGYRRFLPIILFFRPPLRRRLNVN